jgi:phage tail sheath protein FI
VITYDVRQAAHDGAGSLSEANTSGIIVTEGGGSDLAIGCLPTAVTAFVGRALRGPVNRPVQIHSFADYQQVFGGLWQPSTLSYAVEQFFDNGGREAIVVRVVNGGAPATITLPCGVEALTLEAQSPGSREVLRASIDYDNISANEDDRFNLVVQRVRALGSEHIEDQEIFRRISIIPGTARFVATALQESALVRVRGATPSFRPDRTFRAGARHPIGYLDSNPDGDDGAPLTDYDLIGSPERGTGLFALRGVEGAHFLCIPPPTRERDLGPSVLLAASQFCRDRRMMFVVDPPAAWASCDELLNGQRELAFHSDHALMCFPRVLAYDRLRGRYETFANCGAVAGALARMDVHRPLWQAAPDEEVLLRPGTRPARVLTDAERNRLTAHGVNPLQALRSVDPRGTPLKTLAGGSGQGPDSALLTARRRQLIAINSIEHGTRWARFEGFDRSLWARLERQVAAFLEPLAAAGLFGSSTEGAPFHVICDERINSADDLAAGCVNLLVSLRAQRTDDYQSCMITHRPEGSRVRPVRTQRLPAGTRMKTADNEADATLGDTQPRRTLAQSLFTQASEQRAGSSSAARLGVPEASAARRLDLDLVARLNRDFGRRGQRF